MIFLHLFNQELADKYIIQNLMIRTLERDRKYLDYFKSKTVMEKWFDQKILQLRSEFLATKNEMAKIPLTVQSERLMDDMFTEYVFVQEGRSETRHYSNYALRNRTMKALEEFLQVAEN